MYLLLVLDPAILMLIMFLMAKPEFRQGYAKLIPIALVFSFFVQSGAMLIGPFSLLLYVLFLPIALVQFLNLTWKKAFLVLGVFLLVKIALYIGLLFLLTTA